jgi:hypothetical protein
MYKIVSGVKFDKRVLESFLSKDSYIEEDTDIIAIWFWESNGEYCMYPYLFNNKAIAEYVNAEVEEC